MSKKNSNLIPFVLLGVAALLFFQKKETDPPRYTYEPPPPQPQQGQSAAAITAALNQWIVAIVSLYGRSKWLFEPGGPFYGRKKEDINAILDLPPNAGWA